ncbi:hypothetical protein E2C01_046242 [Portunus trituberculatus]|uniref:Uncharacterized protein n=1 Tax=Portunus trituberculatus TaxID=210409 RepID=A0A5B7G782_PORTR|nr:hypothetical protein [Portunus trituberculatus]
MPISPLSPSATGKSQAAALLRDKRACLPSQDLRCCFPVLTSPPPTPPPPPPPQPRLAVISGVYVS